MIFRRVLSALTFSCKRITEITEKEQVNTLSSIDKFRYELHLFMCKLCRSYVKQSQIIEKALGNMFGASDNASQRLDDSARKNILEQLKKEN